jgi:hypothetical protein
MRHRFLILLMSGVAFYALTSTTNAQEKGGVAIVVNRSNKISDMSLEDVRRLFLGEKGSLPNGRRVILLMSPPGTPEREVVLRQIYKMDEREFSRFVLQSAFTGRQSPPHEVPEAAMKGIIAERSDVIGFLPVEQVNGDIRPVLISIRSTALAVRSAGRTCGRAASIWRRAT